MRYVLRTHVPTHHRVLLVESGSRYLFEDTIGGLYTCHHELERVDLVTCYPGAPSNFDATRGEVFRVKDYGGRAGRKRLYAKLRAARYDVIGMICSGEPIMTKWKWTLAWKLPAKVFVLNENADWFWLDRGHWRIIKRFTLVRAGLAGSEGVATLARLALFPLTSGA